MRNVSILLFALLFCFGDQVTAQNWRSKNPGLPAGFQPGAVYGKGNSIIVTQKFGTPQVYYMTDSNAAFVASTSVLSASGYMTTYIVHSGGAEYTGNTYNVFKSTDDAHTWTPTAFSSAAFALYAYNDTLYAGDGTGTRYPKMSPDGGATWISIPYTLGGLPQAFLKSNGVLYLGTTTGVYATTNNGGSWSKKASGDIFCMATLNGDVYAAGSSGVLKSADGMTWTSVFSGDVTCITAIDTSLFIGTRTDGIYQSDKTGINWISKSAGLPAPGGFYTAITQISSNNYFVIAAIDGYDAVYVSKLADMNLPTSVENISSSSQALDFMMTPNPASNEVLIQTGTISADKISVSIYDAAGRSIKSITSNTNRINIDLNDMPAGTYLVQVNQASGHGVKKLVVAK